MWGLSQPIIGALSDKYGSGRVIAIAAVFQILGLLMLANADSLWELHVSTGIIIGIAGSGMTWAVLMSVIARNVPENRRTMFFGVAGAAGTGGQILVVPFNQYTINAFGWSEAILIMSVVMVVIIPLAYVLKGKTEDHSVGRSKRKAFSRCWIVRANIQVTFI